MARFVPFPDNLEISSFSCATHYLSACNRITVSLNLLFILLFSCCHFLVIVHSSTCTLYRLRWWGKNDLSKLL